VDTETVNPATGFLAGGATAFHLIYFENPAGPASGIPGWMESEAVRLAIACSLFGYEYVKIVKAIPNKSYRRFPINWVKVNVSIVHDAGAVPMSFIISNKRSAGKSIDKQEKFM
jgi:hypothetical protein